MVKQFTRKPNIMSIAISLLLKNMRNMARSPPTYLKLSILVQNTWFHCFKNETTIFYYFYN